MSDSAQHSFPQRRGERLQVPTRVLPRSSRNDLSIEADGLLVHLTAPPVESAANEALVALVAERLGVPKRQVRLARGAISRQKVLEIEGLSVEEFWRRLG